MSPLTVGLRANEMCLETIACRRVPGTRRRIRLAPAVIGQDGQSCPPLTALWPLLATIDPLNPLDPRMADTDCPI